MNKYGDEALSRFARSVREALWRLQLRVEALERSSRRLEDLETRVESLTVRVNRFKSCDCTGRETEEIVTAAAEKTRLFPAAIEIAIQPSKIRYDPGETLDYSGIQVRALNLDGSTYRDVNYPAGVIPMAELTFPETAAPLDAEPLVAGDGFITVPFVPSGDLTCTLQDGARIYGYDAGYKFVNVGGQAAVFGPGARINYTKCSRTGIETKSWHNLAYITCSPSSLGDYFYYRNGFGSEINAALPAILPDADSSLTLAEIAGVFKGGTVSGGTRIPVQWTTPLAKFGAEMTFTTTFRIIVEDVNQANAE